MPAKYCAGERGGGTQERVCATEPIMVFFYGYINSIATSFEYAQCRVQLQILKKKKPITNNLKSKKENHRCLNEDWILFR